MLENDVKFDNGVKIRCSKCNDIIAIKEDGAFLIRQVSIAYISSENDIFEAKCKKCGTVNNINIFT